jgi:seryl-tRNA synthetase
MTDQPNPTQTDTEQQPTHEPLTEKQQALFDHLLAERNWRSTQATLKKLGVSSFEEAEAILKANRERDEADALARGEHQKVIEALKPQAEQAERYKATLQKYLDAEIAGIPEDKRLLVPKGDIESQLEWIALAKQSGVFSAPRQPLVDIGAGVVGDHKPQIKMTPGAQNAANIAKQYGYNITPEGVAKRQAQLDEERRNQRKEE